jgi:hypothetical protein
MFCLGRFRDPEGLVAELQVPTGGFIAGEWVTVMSPGESGGAGRALVVQGGGMRNADAVGVLKALYDHAGGADGWDALYAVSST